MGGNGESERGPWRKIATRIGVEPGAAGSPEGFSGERRRRWGLWPLRIWSCNHEKAVLMKNSCYNTLYFVKYNVHYNF
jgi:hypothetical protein